MKLQDLLKCYREENKYTQEDLAKQLFVSRQAISKWECGDGIPDLENIIKLSEIYGLSIDELVRGVPYLSMPFRVGENNIVRNTILLSVYSLILSVVVGSAIHWVLGLTLFVLFEIGFIFILRQGSVEFNRKEVCVRVYEGFGQKLASYVKSEKYSKKYMYQEIEKIVLQYKVIRSLGHGGDWFHLMVITPNETVKIQLTSSKTQKYLPSLVEYLSRKGVEVEDEHGIVEMIAKGIPVYERMHQL